MRIEVCRARPDGAMRIDVRLEDGATVGDAVAASGVVAALGIDATTLAFAIFGRRATAATILHDGDRVELLRPLTIDPMEARRLRAATKDRTVADDRAV